MGARIDIVSIGVRTPLGLQEQAATAIRAGLTSLKKHPFMIDQAGSPLSSSLDAWLDPAIFGPKRFLALADTALLEVCKPFAGSASSKKIAVPLYLGLPEIRPGFSAQGASEIQKGIVSHKGLPVEVSDVKIFTDGHAAGFSALQAAVNDMNNGKAGLCLVGGIESYNHPDTMEWLDENLQLAGEVSRSGFIPGEGAGFIIIATEDIRKRMKLNSLGTIRNVATGNETKLIKTEDTCLGEGLITTIFETVKGFSLPEEKISDIICDMNGERYRGEEWGFVCIRISEYFDNITTYLSPASFWGDVGAASCGLHTMLACQAFGGGYSLGNRCLLWGSSEGGLRGGGVVEFDCLRTMSNSNKTGVNNG